MSPGVEIAGSALVVATVLAISAAGHSLRRVRRSVEC